MIITLVILAIVFFLTAVRQVGNVKLDIWQIMSLGAAGVILTGQISIASAIKAVNVDVLLFLFGMFLIGQALEMSGYLSHLSYRFFKTAGSVDLVVLYILFGMGFASAFLMNDTLAIIGTPVVLLLAKDHHINPKLLLMSLAFAVTTGSVISPIGNPQNLLIALESGMQNPFIEFMNHLLLPTAINLLVAYIFLRIAYRKNFISTVLSHSKQAISDQKLAGLSRISLALVMLLVCIKILMTITGLVEHFDLKLTYIALVAAIPVLIFSERRKEVLKNMDWHTLIFFVAMFVLMESVWDSGFFQNIISSSEIDISKVPMILTISVTLSQLISNVPLVALYIPILLHANVSTGEFVALAAGSTIAGNLSILGAASNVIIIQNAERRSNVSLGFFEFASIGIPLTVVQIFVYWYFIG
ncbi:SLC13 family permease [Methanolobus vulcani]|uniref:Anion transporter n=1 Tax=Methanolobus vulcani TaxID=38026 RepID=A0A7Z8KP59_9EURY|nr:SLC13 family permease [Methanolobus vulcani]TQD26305.1 anion transporter [Methanolobus vulcani]